MYALTSRRWFFPIVLALAILVEVFALRATWRTDTQGDAKLRKLQVRSGYELLLENPPSKDAQPILSYNATSQHDHRLTLDIQSARLSDASLHLLAMVKPPKTPGRLIYAPVPSETKNAGAPCLISFRVEFPADAGAKTRSVEIAPPKADDLVDASTTRLVHLVSSSPLSIRVSANPSGSSDDDSDETHSANGPGCQNLLSIGSWQLQVGKNLELAFVADPGSRTDLTLSSLSFETSRDPVESLEIEPLLPKRLATRPMGLTRVIQSREFAGKPPLTLTDLRLGGDFFDVDLSGRAGIPIPELLGWTKWPILGALDVPLLAFAVAVFRLKRTIFLSYSRADRDRVWPIYERLREAGLDVWIDHEKLRGGVDWEERIRSEMLKCRRIVIFLSQSMNDGGFFLAELGLARAIANDRLKRQAFLVPVRLEKCPIPVILGQWNAIDLFEPDGEVRLFEDLGVRTRTKTGNREVKGIHQDSQSASHV